MSRRLFFTERDRRMLSRFQGSFHRRVLPEIVVHYPTEPVPPDFVSIYRESPSERLLANKTAVAIPGHLLYEPPESEWRADGIDEERQLKASFSREILERGDARHPTGFPFPQRGCLVVAEGNPYYITEVRYRDYFGNSDEWHLLVCWAVKHSPESLGADQDIDVTDEMPPVEIDWDS